MTSSRFLILCSLVAAAVLSWSRAAAASHPPVVVLLQPDATEIDADALRTAVARELDAPVVGRAPDVDAAARPLVTLIVGVDRAHGELVVGRSDGAMRVERRVALPRDPDERLRTAVFLIGNLARDEATELLSRFDREPAPPPSAPPPPPPAVEAAEAEEEAAYPKWWIGAWASGDLRILPSSDNTCKVQGDYYCTTSDGNDYPSLNDGGAQRAAIAADKSDKVVSGLAFGSSRFLLSVERAITAHALLGGRLGLGVAKYPGSQASTSGRMHSEVHLTLLASRRGLAATGVAPVFTFGGGMAEHDASVGVSVVETGVPAMRQVDAWRVSGPLFVSAAFGLRIMPTRSFAITILPLQPVLAFGNGSAALVFSPEMGVQLGF